MKKRKRCPGPDHRPRRCEICLAREGLGEKHTSGFTPIVLCPECQRDAERLDEKFAWEA